MTVIFKKTLLLVGVLLLILACGKPEEKKIDIDEPIIPQLTQTQLEHNAIAQFVSTLNNEQKITQLFLVSVDGTKSHLSATLHETPPGGYVLFSRNTEDGEKNIITLIGDTIEHYSNNNEILPYFSIDQEGGVVNRLRGVSSPLPSAQTVSARLTPSEANELYTYAAMQLEALGIHVNLGPMAEAGYASNMEFTGTRSYGNREQTVLYSQAFLNGFRENGVYCVVKHFPGNTNDDPHYYLPNLKGDKQSILSLYVDPFSTLVSDDGLLMSHVIVPAFDEVNPACLSPIIIDELVKSQLGFDGLLFSDDILMNALLENGYPPDIAISMALKAGVNVLMISHPAYWNIIPIVEDLIIKDASIMSYIDASVFKIIEAKVSMGLYEFVQSAAEDSNEMLLLQKVPIESMYNVENQLNDFYEAKELGDAFYNEHWK